MADLKIQGVVEMSSEGAERALDRVADKADQMAGTVAGSAGKAGAAIDNIGAGAEKSATEFSRAEGRISESIRRATKNIENLGKTASQKLELQISEKGFDAAKFEPALKKLREVEAAAGRAGSVASSSLNSMGMSAAATSAALRGIPAQFTDIITSLQGGQAPLTVLMQQGGQLKDMFGGAGNAAKALGGYVMGLVSPTTLAAAAVGALGVAYYKGSSEASEFTKTLIITGNAAGTTAGQLMDMSRTLSQSTGATRGAVAEALNDIASSGKVSADMLAKVTKAAVDLERTGGQSAAATAKEFASLGDAPADAILKLNDKYHFLTAAVYEQIKALQDQGRETDAARLAQTAYADALENRIPSLAANIGTLESAWKGVTNVAKQAWDSMLGVGRGKTLEEQLAEAQRRVAGYSTERGNGNFGTKTVSGTPADQAIVDALSNEIEARDQLALIQQKSAEAEKAKIEWSKESVKYLDKEAQKKAEILRVTTMMTAAGKSQAEIAKVIAQVDEKYAEKKSASVKALKEDYSELFGRQEQMAIITKALKAETDEIAKANEDYANAVAALLGPIEKESDSLERQLDTYGLTRSEIEATTIARLEEAKALATLNGAGDDAIAFYEREIDARKRIQAAAAGIENNKAWDEAVKESKKAADKAADEWQKSSDKISDSITDALMRGFESGKDFAENLRDAVVNMFSTMVLRPVVQATVVGGLSAVGLAPAGAAAQTLNSTSSLFSAGSSAYNLYSGGSGLYSSFATSGLGQSLGLSALTQSTGVAASTSMGLTIPGMATEMTSLGSTVGAAIPYVGAAIAAIGLLTSALGKGGGAKEGGGAGFDIVNGAAQQSTVNGGRGASAYYTPSGGDAALAATLAPIANSAAALVKSIGGSLDGYSFSLGYDKDPKGTAGSRITSLVSDASGRALYGQTIDTGRDDAAFATAMQAELQREIIAAVKSADVAQIYKDVAGSVDIMTASADDLSAIVTKLGEITALRTAFDKINLGADALTTTLINAAGGTDALASATSSYYDGYFTQEEKTAKLHDELARQFDALNVTMPTTRAGLRSLIESVVATGSDGEATAGKLLALSSSFGTWADAAEAAAKAAADAATAAAKVSAEALKDTVDALYDRLGTIGSSRSNLIDAIFKAQLSGMDSSGQIAAMKAREAELWASLDGGNLDAASTLQETLLKRISLEASLKDDATKAQLESAQTLLDSMKSVAAFATSMRDEVANLQSGDLSPLSYAEQLAAAQTQWQETLAKAQAGDTTAQSSLSSVGNAYLKEAQSYYGANGDYASTFNSVTGAMTRFASSAPTETVIESQQTLVTNLTKAASEQTNTSKEQVAALKSIDTALAKQQGATEAQLRQNGEGYTAILAALKKIDERLAAVESTNRQAALA